MLFLALANKLCVTILMGLGGDEFFLETQVNKNGRSPGSKLGGNEHTTVKTQIMVTFLKVVYFIDWTRYINWGFEATVVAIVT